MLTTAAMHGTSSLGLRFNWTFSAPVGIYREIPGPSRCGDLALLCLPSDLESLGRARRYLSAGNCGRGSSPVLKQVVALPGDEVEVQQNFFAVNGRMLDRSELREVDSLGRPLAHVPLGHRKVPDGEAWVLGIHRDRSWDSRYFGPIPIESIVVRVEPLLVFGRSD
ncbi:MAG: conjugative transfer signal peptidase TraF [Deltaproteobacteria bacterium]|nr:conjugative transfer signal peptidase TraF [Deltaproteobacteria bacterium]